MSGVGIFELKTPRQLLEKVEHDFDRLRANPIDAFAAFDLFVTARHVPDWLHPNDPSKRSALFEQHVELRVCRHIAEGAKHFILHDARHQQVRETARTGDSWGGAWGKAWGGAWGTDALMIELDAADP